MRDSKLSKDARVHLPFCLFPSEFSRKWFYYAYDLQMSMNLILHKVAHSKEIIRESLKSTIEADEFTKNIYQVFEDVFDNQNQQTSLGLIRCDYLLTCDLLNKINGIKQVENNTIAVGFGGISCMLRDLYRFTLEKLKWKEDLKYNLPENESLTLMANAIVLAWQTYNKKSAIILFITEESTFNIYDQRLLEYKIVELNNQIEVLRHTFKDLRKCLSFKKEEGILYINTREVAVVYFRVGYAPEHYESQDWKTRLVIEQSKAIKCPSAGLHLAGTKKVQMYLTQEGILEKFVEPSTAKKLRRVFADQHSLDVADENKISEAITHHENFVLKPEREGGGNNLYGSDIKTFLENERNKKSFILMEKIKSPSTPNCIIRKDKPPEFCLVHNELGIFGVILGTKDHIYMNQTAGHLLRSKPVRVNEGGVACGSGALDYPYLV